MGWLSNISFSSANSSPVVRSSGSGGESPRRRRSSSSDDHNYRGAWRFGTSKYGRGRKFRNLSDRDCHSGSSPKWSDSPADSSSDSLPVIQSSSSCNQAVPLPLPECSGVCRRTDGLLNSSSGDADCPLPSPKAGLIKGVEERDRCREKATCKIGDEDLSDFGIKSVFDCRKRQTKKDRDEMRSSRTVHQQLNGYSETQDNFRVDVPIRSAPTSPFSSPIMSPQRTSRSGDLFYKWVPTGNQVWSAPEMPISTMVPGLPPPAFFDCYPFSTDNSPIQSPRVRSPHRDPRSPTGATSPLHTKRSLESPSGAASPMHPKLSLEATTVRRESTSPVNVHPLPLPPGAPLPSPTPVSQVTAKPDTLSMKSQWQKGKLIGRGTFGSVYVASNRKNGSLCAMKEVELFPDDPKSAECIKQLEQEIKVLSQLKHPNIVQYYGSEIVGDRFYIYLEYVHPGSINKYVREHCGAMTESVVQNFTRHILSGLAYLHSTKTIHRDIKGANLLVDSSGVVKLADFGMAKHLTGQAADLSLKGSPYWMAPELMQAVMQKDNNSDLALAVDIWSLGCTIIEMLTGKPPWSEYEGAAAMFKVMRDTPPIPESLSPEGKDFLRCCFQRNPADRHSAIMLLEHRFVKISLQPDVSSCTQALSMTNLMDKSLSPREQSKIKLDQLPISPNSQKANGLTSPESDSAKQSHHETPDLSVTSRYSPRSTLEALPSLSPPRAVQNKLNSNPAATISNSGNNCAKKNHIFR